MSRNKKRGMVNEENIWQCCGNYYAKTRSCKVCGRRIDNRAIGNGNAKPEQGEQVALVKKVKIKEALRGTAGRYTVTIERHGRRLDSDNFIGGAKQLRDAIATALGKTGDDISDGLEFCYRQVPSKSQKTVIRVKAL